jgi:crotonobetainyl-CoA:carnitine CoA-transferase CaiB-like acyl-CoA transferase
VRCCQVLGADGLLEDPRFVDNAARVRHRDDLTSALEAILQTRPSADWLEVLAAEGVPAAEVQDVSQVFSGAQTEALGAVQRLRHPGAGDYRVVGPPLRLDHEVLTYPRPAPTLGADTRSVLSDVGLSEVEIDALVAEGAAIG